MGGVRLSAITDRGIGITSKKVLKYRTSFIHRILVLSYLICYNLKENKKPKGRVRNGKKDTTFFRLPN